tara:strand:+ start:185 stop:874 length:690 start_codon:yes stop_codon:yes gene_type:complete
MSTLRITNIEAKADASSPSVDEKVKIKNSGGDTLLQLDGSTSGVSTVTVGNKITLQGDTGSFIATTGTFSGDISGRNVTGVAATFTGALKVGGVLTYEDVTNVDSVGVVTARNGIRVGAGKSIGSDGAAVVYYGDGSNLTGIDASSIKYNNDIKVQANNSGVIITGITTVEGTGGIKMPRGTTTERPSVGSTSNYMRYNTTNSALEFYNGTGWVELVGEYNPSSSFILG